MSETMMSEEEGYVCIPYIQNNNFVILKNTLEKSAFIKDMYLVTATFSKDTRQYFSSSSNTYLLARFKDSLQIICEVEKYQQDTPTFVFVIKDEFFERLNNENLNLLSIYYLDEYSTSDLSDLGFIVAKRSRVRRADLGHLQLFATLTQKFTFPYSKNLITLEISSDSKHQADSKYCEKTRKEVHRKGIGMTNLLNLSIIERIK
jgi:hypothetical protein